MGETLGNPYAVMGRASLVISEGGRIVWLAGQTGTTDDQGKSLAGDFEGQGRQIFRAFDNTLQKAGGKLADMVQMTVFVTDVRYGERLWQIRICFAVQTCPGAGSFPRRPHRDRAAPQAASLRS
jgi:enamine deaminase RidA (YjgF/YER057c/UK114 family)